MVCFYKHTHGLSANAIVCIPSDDRGHRGYNIYVLGAERQMGQEQKSVCVCVCVCVCVVNLPQC